MQLFSFCSFDFFLIKILFMHSHSAASVVVRTSTNQFSSRQYLMRCLKAKKLNTKVQLSISKTFYYFRCVVKKKINEYTQRLSLRNCVNGYRYSITVIAKKKKKISTSFLKLAIEIIDCLEYYLHSKLWLNCILRGVKLCDCFWLLENILYDCKPSEWFLNSKK